MSWKDYQKTGKLGTKADKIKSLGLLIVDDEKGIVDTLAESFKTTMTVYTADSGEAALQIFKDKEVHVIISDQRMPGMTGVDLFARIKEIDPVPTRILVTGYSDIGVVIRAVNDGLLWKYVTKPWDPDELTKLVVDGARHYLKEAGLERDVPRLLGM